MSLSLTAQLVSLQNKWLMWFNISENESCLIGSTYSYAYHRSHSFCEEDICHTLCLCSKVDEIEAHILSVKNVPPKFKDKYYEMVIRLTMFVWCRVLVNLELTEDESCGNENVEINVWSYKR